MKLAIVGAGSTYTPELTDGIARRPALLRFTEIWLYDTDISRLQVLTEFSKRQLNALKHSAKIFQARSLPEALDGADFVVSQIRVGGQAARQRDTELGLKHNLVGQETVGCGGFACALRHIPASIEIAKTMGKCCPEATLINFTNPAGIVTQALRRASEIQVVGICNVPYVMAKDIAAHQAVSVESVELDYFGLNHLSWAAKIKIAGVDRTKEILQHYSELNAERYNFPADLIQALEALPSPYLRYYYLTHEVLTELKQAHRTRAQEVMELESLALRQLADPMCCDRPAELMKRGGIYYGEVAASVMEALSSEKPLRRIVNLPNGTVFPWLSPEAVIEYPWQLSRDRHVPDPPVAVPPAMKSLIIQIKTYETLTIEAAITGSRRAAFLALLVNPLVDSASKARSILDEIYIKV